MAHDPVKHEEIKSACMLLDGVSGVSPSILTRRLSDSNGISTKRSRYIIRCAIDIGLINTDKFFKLHKADA